MFRKSIRRGSFHSLIELQAAVKRYLAEYNTQPKPFVWTPFAASIIAKVDSPPTVRMSWCTSRVVLR